MTLELFNDDHGVTELIHGQGRESRVLDLLFGMESGNLVCVF